MIINNLSKEEMLRKVNAILNAPEAKVPVKYQIDFTYDMVAGIINIKVELIQDYSV